MTADRNHRYIPRGKTREHVLIAERAIKRKLAPANQVHHVNGDGKDNRPENLVICENAGFHRLLHMRTEALAACGNPSWLRCSECRQWDHPEALVRYKYRYGSPGTYHAACRRRKRREKTSALLGREVRARK